MSFSVHCSIREIGCQSYISRPSRHESGVEDRVIDFPASHECKLMSQLESLLDSWYLYYHLHRRTSGCDASSRIDNINGRRGSTPGRVSGLNQTDDIDGNNSEVIHIVKLARVVIDHARHTLILGHFKHFRCYSSFVGSCNFRLGLAVPEVGVAESKPSGVGLCTREAAQAWCHWDLCTSA